MKKSSIIVFSVIFCVSTIFFVYISRNLFKSIKAEVSQKIKEKLDSQPCHLINIWWFFEDLPDFQRLDIDITVTDVSRDFNFYISPINTSINDCSLYAGIQTNTLGKRSKTNRFPINLGKGGIFSRWSQDEITPIGYDYVDMFDDGACDSSGAEGGFCSVRRPFDWTSGTYTLSLIKENTILYNNIPHTWVAYEITEKKTNDTKRIGRLLFEGQSLKLRDDFCAFVEVYGINKKIPPATVTFGFPKVNGIEQNVYKVYAYRPHTTPNVTTVSSQGCEITVTLDPENPRPEPISKAHEHFILRTDTVEIMTSSNSHFLDLIFIPLKMNDSIYPFLFSTGLWYNVIDSVLAQKIELNYDKQTSSFFNSKKYSIGTMKIDDAFHVNGYKGNFYTDVETMQNVGAMMGMETICQFNWLFDFSDNTVTISNDKLMVPVLFDDQALTLDYSIESGQTCMNLTMFGRTMKNVIFATNAHKEIHVSNKFKNIDIMFSKSDFELFEKKQPDSIALDSSKTLFIEGLETNNGHVFFFDSLKINDYTLQGLLAYRSKEGDQTVITANFVRRFRMMYIDSSNKKIHLYVSPSDSARHHRKEILLVNQTLRQYNNAGSMPTALIDSIW